MRGLEPNEYSYFNPDTMSGWLGGPNHWKLFSIHGNHSTRNTSDKGIAVWYLIIYWSM